MDILKIIKDEDFGLKYPPPIKYKERRAARAIVFDKDKNIALLFVTKKNYHKLPGGGIEEGESIIDALKRELLEETGCLANNIQELGIIEEYRNKFELHQLSYCFLANVAGAKGTPHFDEGEIAQRFELVWMGAKEAIKILENEEGVKDYEGKFIRLRDLVLLKEAARRI